MISFFDVFITVIFLLLLAVQFGKDSDFASIGVVLSTICSIVTLPLMYLFMNAVLGVAI